MKTYKTFKKFGSEEIFSLGKIGVEHSMELGKDIAIEIFLNGKISFMFIPSSMGLDKVDWLKRKRNSVIYFGMSTLDLNLKLGGNEKLLSEKYALRLSEFTIVAGSIPIVIEDVGIVGALTITGLKPEEDHDFAEKILEEILKELNK